MWSFATQCTHHGNLTMMMVLFCVCPNLFFIISDCIVMFLGWKWYSLISVFNTNDSNTLLVANYYFILKCKWSFFSWRFLLLLLDNWKFLRYCFIVSLSNGTLFPYDSDCTVKYNNPFICLVSKKGKKEKKMEMIGNLISLNFIAEYVNSDTA